MLTPTRLTGPLTDRDLDVFDVTVLEAMRLQGLGPDTDAMFVHRADGVLRIELTPLGRATLLEMSATVDVSDMEGWMEILAPGLVEDAVDEVGEDWRAEAELAVELLAAERCDEMGALAKLAIAGPLVVSTERTLATILAEQTCDPMLVTLM